MNSKESISTTSAPQPIGTFSQAIRAGNTIYLSGQIGACPTTGNLVVDSIEAQTQQAFSNVKAVAEAAGGSLDDIVKLTIFITDFKNFPTVNSVMEKLFTKPYPARSTIGVASLPKNADVEVESIMVLNN